jgi:hypothetical protein
VQGLPPPPADVVVVEQFVNVNGLTVSTAHALLSSGSSFATVAYLQDLAAAWIFNCANEYAAVMHQGAELAAVRLTTYGGDLTRVTFPFPPNHGAWPGGQASQVALCWHWLTAARGRGRQGVTRVPAVPDQFIDSNRRISNSGYANMVEKGSNLYDAMRALPAYLGGTCVPVTVHRSRNGVPLSASTYEPIVGVQTSRRVATVRRRLSDSDLFSLP